VSRLSLASVVALAAGLVLSGCGRPSATVSTAADNPATSSAAPSSSSTSLPVPTTTTSPSTTDTPGASNPPAGFQGVEYAGLQFRVPDDWPVYDLSKDPSRCVRFDHHAVYLGHAGAKQDCPAQLVGRTEAVQVEPIDATSQTTAARAKAPIEINGIAVRLDPSSGITRSLVAAFDSASIVATVTFSSSDALAQKVLHTFERSGG
jgi:hypothetical protein